MGRLSHEVYMLNGESLNNGLVHFVADCSTANLKIDDIKYVREALRARGLNVEQ